MGLVDSLVGFENALLDELANKGIEDPSYDGLTTLSDYIGEINNTVQHLIKIRFDDKDNIEGLRPNNVTENFSISLSNPNTIPEINYYDEQTIYFNAIPDNIINISTPTLEKYSLTSETIGDNLHLYTYYRTVEFEDYTLSIVWDDNNDADSMRPSSINVSINSQTYILNNNSNWSKTVTLQKYVNGEAQTYTWNFPAVTGYTTSQTVVNKNTIVTYRNRGLS